MENKDPVNCRERQITASIINLVTAYARSMDPKSPKLPRDLQPELTDEQLVEAADTLDRYLELVLRIFERHANESMHRPTN